MSTLFEITREFEDLYIMATDPECDEEVFRDTLEALTGELEVKGQGYVSVIKQLEMEAEQADKVAKAFMEKKKRRENHIKRMKEALKEAMERTGKKEIAAGDWKIKLKINGGLQPLVIKGEVPDNMTKVTIEPDNTKIREYLKTTTTCDWAYLDERGTHVSIEE